jgi:cell wall-associated NlpC family hydrolase
MRFNPSSVALALICAFTPVLGSAQEPGSAQKMESPEAPSRLHAARHERTFSPDDGLSVIAAALDSHIRTTGEADCSHLVHAIYEKAGFPYPYASSTDLYAGSDDFRRVPLPQPGDLVVWTGHVGIVVNPAKRAFFSALRNGPGVDFYDAQYWKQRGQARFYRYKLQSSAHDVAKPKSR